MFSRRFPASPSATLHGVSFFTRAAKMLVRDFADGVRRADQAYDPQTSLFAPSLWWSWRLYVFLRVAFSVVAVEALPLVVPQPNTRRSIQATRATKTSFKKLNAQELYSWLVLLDVLLSGRLMLARA